MEKPIISVELKEKWRNYNKAEYLFTSETLDVQDFTQTVKETFQAIKNFKICLNTDKKEVEPEEIYNYTNLMVEIAKYSAELYYEPSGEDEYIYITTTIVARMLLYYVSYGCSRINPTDDNGVLVCYREDCEIDLPYPYNRDEFWEKSFSYDTNTGDMSEIMEVVKRYYGR